MTDDEIRRSLLDASRSLDVVIETYCEQLNNKENLRYFHANAHSPDDSSSKWRLKVVNQCHDDYAKIQACNCNNNYVHRRLASNKSLQSIIAVPTYFEVPLDRLNDISCSELIMGEMPTNDDLPLIVDVLIKLRANPRSILDDLTRFADLMPCSVNSYNRPVYRNKRLKFSVNGLLKKGLLSSEDVSNIMNAFDQNFETPLPEDRLSFVHGDFSYGNLKIRGNKLVFIDFEHSHIGIGEIDLAHLFVNLKADGQDDAASMLRKLYKEKSIQQGLSFNHAMFQALVLERVAGKMNSMTSTDGEKWEKLKTMLLSKKVIED